ncbi:hypothetical protein [Paraclostridium bifermentans]|uniref:hypothetical protein n=1 Tax=Paraclostridium bifermentans TaxID=1490 RepID=UPI00359C2CAD
MKKTTNEYKEISLELIEKLKSNDVDNINEILDKRQEIIENVSDEKIFKDILIKDGIKDIDNQIHLLLEEKITEIKHRIKDHNKSKQANDFYMNFNKDKLNIFNKKV